MTPAGIELATFRFVVHITCVLLIYRMLYTIFFEIFVNSEQFFFPSFTYLKDYIHNNFKMSCEDYSGRCYTTEVYQLILLLNNLVEFYNIPFHVHHLRVLHAYGTFVSVLHFTFRISLLYDVNNTLILKILILKDSKNHLLPVCTPDDDSILNGSVSRII